MGTALQGLVVLDLSQYIAGPYATMLMADEGATVIKIEAPTGDATRSLEPFIAGDGGQVSAFFARMNRGKKSITLDLKSPEGHAAMAALVRKADVLVENYRAGILARLGFDADELARLNPRLIYCSVSGFGHTPSPNRDRAAYNTVAEYEAGVYRASQHGEAPTPVGPPVGDMVPALHALAGLLMALYRRSVTGQGARVDIAMFDSMLSLNELRSSMAVLLDSDRLPTGADLYCPYGVFAVRDGHLSIDVTTPRQWQGFCDAIGQPELAQRPGMDTGPARAQQYQAHIRAPLEAWLGDKTRDEAAAALVAHGVPVAVLRTPREALLSEQARSRDMCIQVQGEHGVRLNVPASPIRIAAAADGARDTAGAQARRTVPALAADSRWVLEQIAGLDADTVNRLCTAPAHS